jgi:hypothetical protein
MLICDGGVLVSRSSSLEKRYENSVKNGDTDLLLTQTTLMSRRDDYKLLMNITYQPMSFSFFLLSYSHVVEPV